MDAGDTRGGKKNLRDSLDRSMPTNDRERERAPHLKLSQTDSSTAVSPEIRAVDEERGEEKEEGRNN